MTHAEGAVGFGQHMPDFIRVDPQKHGLAPAEEKPKKTRSRKTEAA